MTPTTTSKGNQRKARHYNQVIKGAHSQAQNQMVVSYMQKIAQPTTIRNLHKIMNGRGYQIDLVSLRRAVTNLSKPDPKGRWINQWGRQVLREAFERPCPITEVTVGWYELIPATPQQTQLF